jgi:PAS domain-containing protein
VQKANRAFCQTFDVSLAQAMGRPVFDLAERQWDLPPLRRMLEEVLRGSKTIDGQRIDHEFQGLGRKAFLVEARRIESSRPDGGVILLVIREDASAAASSGPRAG